MNQPCPVAGKVSIVIPCYNHGAMLREAIASVNRARNNNLLEVIIVNDGSTDAMTLEVFAELEAANYIVLHQPNSGLGAARNSGIRAAAGEFIIPLDSDNLIRSTYLVDGVAALNKNPNLGVVYGHAQYFGERSGQWSAPAFDPVQLATWNQIDACALVRKSAWASVAGYDEQMPHMGYEDWDLWLRLAASGWDFFRMDEIAYDYRVRTGSMIEVTKRHQQELLQYIFRKPENRFAWLVREREFEREHLKAELASIRNSKDFRLGRLLLRPARALKNLTLGHQ